MLHFKRRLPAFLRFPKSQRAAWRKCMNPTAELERSLRAIDENRIKAFLDVVAQLAVEDVMREQEEAVQQHKNRFRVRIRCA